MSPLFLFSQNKEIVQDYFLNNSKRGNQIEFIIESESYSTSMKGDVVKLQQTINNIPIHNAVASALIANKKVQYISDSFDYSITQSRTITPTLSASSIFNKLGSTFSILNTINYQILNWEDSEKEIQNFTKQRLVYFIKDEKPILAYEFIFPESNSANFWNIITDASSGEILKQQNLNLSCNHFNSNSQKHSAIQEISFLKDALNQNLSVPNNSSYNVYALPVESPNFGSRTIEINPFILNSSPEGWHSDGINSYTITRGNNVYAYEDAAGNNQPGFSPDGGSSRNFNFLLNLSLPAINNRSAAITNLFYTANKSHDLFYQLGFNENSRNFQTNNFGKGGKQNDALFAEAQNGEDLNNANFATPPDGTAPRMQMFLWSPAFVQRLFYNAPSSAISRQPNSRNANFGPSLSPSGITADIQIAAPLNACNPLPANSMFQKIGLAERGDCTFTIKVKNIQDAGGIGAIIFNAANSPNFNAMGGSDATITIPSILIENSEGNFIKNIITSGVPVNATLKNDESTDIFADGSFDNGIIIHEYAHGVTNRSTGSGYSCLDKNISREQMGEGWSDFFSLMFTSQPNATSAQARSVGTFALGQTSNENGLRLAKYSPDFAINNFTYGKTNGMEFLEDNVLKPDVHAIGFVWASTLWDLHWKFVDMYGFSSDILAQPNSGSAKVVQIVQDALKIQECNPTFTSGRDAIIAADIAINNGKNRCVIWETFAKRGIGVDASAGAKANINDQTEDFKIPEECISGEATAEFFIYPNPAKEEFSINFPVSAFGKAMVNIYDTSGRLITSFEKLVVNSRQRFSTQKLSNGNYFVKINALGGEKTLQLIVAK